MGDEQLKIYIPLNIYRSRRTLAEIPEFLGAINQNKNLISVPTSSFYVK